MRNRFVLFSSALIVFTVAVFLFEAHLRSPRRRAESRRNIAASGPRSTRDCPAAETRSLVARMSVAISGALVPHVATLMRATTASK